MHHLINTTVFCLLLVPVLALAGAVDAKDALVERLNSLKSMQAEFEQHTVNERGEVINTSLGSLALVSGGKFNIATRAPFPQLLVADGVDLYSYDEDLNQVIVKPLGQNIKQVPILLFGNTNLGFLEDYKVSQHVLDNGADAEFSLQPRIPDSVFETLILSFDAATPSSLTMTDSLGQVTSIQFSDVQINHTIPEATFQYVVPEGVDLIDDR